MPAKPKRARANGRAPHLRYAVVGLGHIAQVAILPAFAHARGSCRLTGLISDDPAKQRALSRRYGVEHVWTYDDYDDALASDAFDAVYIALPNHLHAEFAIRAANAGRHVLCEKPLALSVRDCDDMIDAAGRNGVRLMTAYRLHLDPANLAVVDAVRSGRIGEVIAFDATFGMRVAEGNIRTRRATGGGTLWDIGIYCINAARYCFRDEPTEVFCVTGPGAKPHLPEVEGLAAATLSFEDGRVATFTCSFTSSDVATYSLLGSKGRITVDQAFEYVEPITVTTTVGKRTTRKRFAVHDQFAAELEYFAECVRKRREPVPSGAEGRADVAIIRALYASADRGKPVHLNPPALRKRPDGRLSEAKPPVRRKPRLVHTESPHP